MASVNETEGSARTRIAVLKSRVTKRSITSQTWVDALRDKSTRRLVRSLATRRRHPFGNSSVISFSRTPEHRSAPPLRARHAEPNMRAGRTQPLAEAFADICRDLNLPHGS